MKPRDYITRFCAAGDDVRYFLTQPCRTDGKLYASNGHILICTEDDPAVEVIGADELIRRSKKIALTLPDNEQAFQPLVIDLPEAEACAYCEGGGKTKLCPACKGAGEINDVECRACNGNCDQPGKVSAEATDTELCWCCDGTGERLTQPVAVGFTFFARRYLALIQILPNLTFSLPATPTSTAYFRFDGGWGALMPCRGADVMTALFIFLAWAIASVVLALFVGRFISVGTEEDPHELHD